jgi:hypothetical protein
MPWIKAQETSREQSLCSFGSNSFPESNGDQSSRHSTQPSFGREQIVLCSSVPRILDIDSYSERIEVLSHSWANGSHFLAEAKYE